MATLITVIHVVACIFLILVVLLQAGKGGGVGVALGGQTSAQVFGGRGAGNFLERLTAGTAIVFMLTSMSLAYIASKSDSARLQKRTVDAAAKKKLDDQKTADETARKTAEDRALKDAPAAAPKEAGEPTGVEVAPKAEPVKVDAPKAEPVKVDAPKTEAAPKAKKAAPKVEAPKTEAKPEAPAEAPATE